MGGDEGPTGTETSEAPDNFDRFERTRDVILLGLMVAEVAYLWVAYKDSPQGLLLRARFQGFLARTVASRCQHCREFRESRSNMLWQASLAAEGLKVDDRGVVVPDE